MQRFRTTEEAREALWSEPGSEETVRRLRAVLETMRRLAPNTIRPGVTKFRSFAEANRDRSAGS